jgi:hypothetical protein
MVLFLQLLTTLLISVTIEIIVVKNLPKWQKTEHEECQRAKQQHEVYFPKMLTNYGVFLASVLSAIGILLVLFPQICESVGFDYQTTLIIVWVPIILGLVVYSCFFVKIKYNEEAFEYTNAFGYRKTFRYEDIHDVIEKNGFVTIMTEKKKIRFGKGLYGADRFTAYLKKRISK